MGFFPLANKKKNGQHRIIRRERCIKGGMVSDGRPRGGHVTREDVILRQEVRHTSGVDLRSNTATGSLLKPNLKRGRGKKSGVQLVIKREQRCAISGIHYPAPRGQD